MSPKRRSCGGKATNTRRRLRIPWSGKPTNRHYAVRALLEKSRKIHCGTTQFFSVEELVADIKSQAEDTTYNPGPRCAQYVRQFLDDGSLEGYFEYDDSTDKYRVRCKAKVLMMKIREGIKHLNITTRDEEIRQTFVLIGEKFSSPRSYTKAQMFRKLQQTIRKLQELEGNRTNRSTPGFDSYSDAGTISSEPMDIEDPQDEDVEVPRRHHSPGLIATPWLRLYPNQRGPGDPSPLASLNDTSTPIASTSYLPRFDLSEDEAHPELPGPFTPVAHPSQSTPQRREDIPSSSQYSAGLSTAVVRAYLSPSRSTGQEEDVFFSGPSSSSSPAASTSTLPPIKLNVARAYPTPETDARRGRSTDRLLHTPESPSPSDLPVVDEYPHVIIENAVSFSMDLPDGGDITFPHIDLSPRPATVASLESQIEYFRKRAEDAEESLNRKLKYADALELDVEKLGKERDAFHDQAVLALKTLEERNKLWMNTVRELQDRLKTYIKERRKAVEIIEKEENRLRDFRKLALCVFRPSEVIPEVSFEELQDFVEAEEVEQSLLGQEIDDIFHLFLLLLRESQSDKEMVRALEADKALLEIERDQQKARTATYAHKFRSLLNLAIDETDQFCPATPPEVPP